MESLIALRDQIDLFFLVHPDILMRDDRAGWLRFSELKFCLEIQHEKLVFTFWNSELSVTRHILSIKRLEKDHMILRGGNSIGREMELEFEARISTPSQLERNLGRRQFVDQMRSLLRSSLPSLRVDNLVGGKDLSRSLSEQYCRGSGFEGNCRWALFGVNPNEDQSTVDNSLAFGLIWLEELRRSSGRGVIAGIRLLVPEGSSGTLASRIAFLRREKVVAELWEYDGSILGLTRIDPADYGNLDTRLSRVDRVPLPVEETPCDRLPPPLRSNLASLEIVHRPLRQCFSIRYKGLEFARLNEEGTPMLTYGVGSTGQVYIDRQEGDLSKLLADLLYFRRADSADPLHPFFRLQSERWLESIVLSDIRQVRYDLDPRYVYPQVPAFSGLDRGVIDVLTLTRQGRLAVIELKVAEDIHLPLQALDYWTRVRWHQMRGDFERQGYFPGTKVTMESPLLLLVCPAFRFHSSTEGILNYFPPDIEIVKVGINEDWRSGIQVLYRR
jgi:hypothetical protein